MGRNPGVEMKRREFISLFSGVAVADDTPKLSDLGINKSQSS
jgi:hypothetical protein